MTRRSLLFHEPEFTAKRFTEESNPCLAGFLGSRTRRGPSRFQRIPLHLHRPTTISSWLTRDNVLGLLRNRSRFDQEKIEPWLFPIPFDMNRSRLTLLLRVR